ncbi:hypothetical protein EYF80_039598 [Liparis tanakae]|uniref:Uncharacterized protein n=1 Tax=Liparis tanakae TaxID=230148 RepID=A0A4Z2GBS8_9TELE|nr:hypothetical protein EYF80_039598 [Liparis tanakae]
MEYDCILAAFNAPSDCHYGHYLVWICSVRLLGLCCIRTWEALRAPVFHGEMKLVAKILGELGTSMLAVEGPSGLEGVLLEAPGQGNYPSVPSSRVVSGEDDPRPVTSFAESLALRWCHKGWMEPGRTPVGMLASTDDPRALEIP